MTFAFVCIWLLTVLSCKIYQRLRYRDSFKFHELLATWWKFFWRLAVFIMLFTGDPEHLGVPVAIALCVSTVMVVFLDAPLKSFPVIRLLRGKPITDRRGKKYWNQRERDQLRWEGHQRSTAHEYEMQNLRHRRERRSSSGSYRENEIARQKDESNRQRQLDRFLADHRGNFLGSATRQGQITGFEPRTLAGVEVTQTPLVHGTPGAGLASSGFDQGAIAAGQLGETNFAKSLSKTGSIEKVDSFWSVSMPDERGNVDREYSSDIDCVLMSTGRIVLVDIKNYPQGDVEYETLAGHLLVKDVATQQYIGEPRSMGRNMELATKRFTAAFPGHLVESVVVLMPTDNGMGQARNLEWTGGVRIETLPGFLSTVDYLFTEIRRPSYSDIIKVERLLRK